MNEEPPVRLYRIPEVAVMLGLSKVTVYDLINKGQLEALKIGKNSRITKDALDAFIANLPRTGRAARDAARA